MDFFIKNDIIILAFFEKNWLKFGLFCRLHASGNWWVSPRFLHQWTENQGWSNYSCPHSNVPDFRTRRNMRWFFRSRLGSHLWQAALVKWCCRSNFYGSRYIFWIWYHLIFENLFLDSFILEILDCFEKLAAKNLKTYRNSCGKTIEQI